MKLREIVATLGLEVRAGEDRLDREIGGGYASDLLSDVMANSRAGDLWVTLQSHENTVAVAALRDLVGVVLVGSRQPDDETVRRAQEEGVPILISPDHTYEVVGKLIDAGVRGREDP